MEARAFEDSTAGGYALLPIDAGTAALRSASKAGRASKGSLARP